MTQREKPKGGHVLIGKEGALSPAQEQVVLTSEQETKRVQGLSNKNLAGEIRRAMRKNPENLLTQALGTVTLVAFNEGRKNSFFDFGQDWYCRRTGPNRPKVGRSKKKSEFKKQIDKQV
jgi:hypothetical protein